LMTAFNAVRGAIVVTLDGDGQNDPADIPAMLVRLDQADLVVGVRAQRRDSTLRKTMSRVANGVRRRWLSDGVSDTGCALKVFRREVIASFLPIRTLYSFIPACAAAAGFRVVEYRVHHRHRTAGVSKYGLWTMLWRPLADMLALGWVLRRRIPRVTADESAADP
jgi:dolichol-phosphate mannosyltransferase